MVCDVVLQFCVWSLLVCVDSSDDLTSVGEETTPPLPVSSPDMKGGGLYVGLATHHVNEHCYGNTGNTFRNQTLEEEPRTEAAMPCMMNRDEIREDVSTPMESLAKPKHIVRVAAWKVRTMYETGRAAEVVGEMKRYKVNILGVSEMRWTDSGILTLISGETVCYSGRMDGLHQEGEGIIMDKAAKKSLLGWEPVNSRIIRARFSPSM